MSPGSNKIVKAVHGLKESKLDPDFEIGLAEYLRTQYGQKPLIELYARFVTGDGDFDGLMRRTIWRY
jgi:hypothetical protein